MRVSSLGNLTKKLNGAYLKLYHPARTARQFNSLIQIFGDYSSPSNGGRSMLVIKKTRGRNMRMTIGLGVLTGLAFVGTPANAATTTQQFTVQLQIQAQCVINSTATLDFGTAGVLGGFDGSSNVDQTTTLKVQCTNSTPYNIGIDGGTTTGGTTAQRLLVGGTSAATIQYNLYTTAGRSVIWGNTVNTDTVPSTGTGAQQTFTIYGRVPGQNTPIPDTYTDHVLVTITY
jgi:spore coat protein U-like protein